MLRLKRTGKVQYVTMQGCISLYVQVSTYKICTSDMFNPIHHRLVINMFSRCQVRSKCSPKRPSTNTKRFAKHLNPLSAFSESLCEIHLSTMFPVRVHSRSAIAMSGYCAGPAAWTYAKLAAEGGSVCNISHDQQSVQCQAPASSQARKQSSTSRFICVS